MGAEEIILGLLAVLGFLLKDYLGHRRRRENGNGEHHHAGCSASSLETRVNELVEDQKRVESAMHTRFNRIEDLIR